MFKTETHLHTKETSRCSHLTAEEMVEYYHNAGYHTVFISDHMHADYYNGGTDISKQQAAERFLLGYHHALTAGKKYGMNVLLSAEYSVGFNGIYNHYLVYGIDEDFIYNNLNGPDMTIEKLRKAVNESGAMLIQAHPFRDICFPTPTYVDGMEVLNSNPRHFVDTDEKRTAAVVSLYHLYTTAGSDAHRSEDIAGTGMGSDYEIKTGCDFVELIRSGKGTVLNKE